MPAQMTRSDSLREYLTGSLVDGGAQITPNKSLGNYRSSTEAASFGITIGTPITNCIPLYAAGGNPVGAGTLNAVDSSHLTWQPAGAVSPGPPTTFTGTNDIQIVEAANFAGQYLRIKAAGAFSVGPSTITLAYLINNIFGFDNLNNPASEVFEYRATIVRNEALNDVQAFQRWIATLGTTRISDAAWLTGAGAGTITTSGSLADWPTTGWCQVQTSGGTIKEVVYYSARTDTTLTIPGAGRGLLGTTPSIGSATDTISAVPGIALGLDPLGIQAFGAGIQQVPNQSTAPAGVIWNLGLTAAAGLQIGTLPSQQQIGIWMWRNAPAGAISTPLALTKMLDSFNAF